MKNYLSPAEVVCDVFGGPPAVARVLGLSRATPWRWVVGGGLGPSEYHRPLITEARAAGLELSATDLVHGRFIAGGLTPRPRVIIVLRVGHTTIDAREGRGMQ